MSRYVEETSFFEKALNLGSDAIFLSDDHHKLTFNELKSFSKKISSDLRTLELEPGALVLLDIRNPFYFIAYVLACGHLKLRPALLNSFFKKEQIDGVLKNNSYSMFITDQEDHPASLTQGSLATYVNSTLPFQFEAGELSIDLNSEILFFTSGSIECKACVLTLSNFFFNALGAGQNIPFTRGHTWGLCLPLFHVGGFSILIRAILGQAHAKIVSNDFSGVTHLSLVSTQFVRHIDVGTDFKSVKFILLGGSAIPETSITKALELGLPIYKSYGMTEMASQICTSKQITRYEEIQYSGLLLNYREIKLSDQRIYVNGPCLFKGYLKNNILEKPFEEDGWFLTKDLGILENGQIKIFGRSDRIFQSGGENISPEIIEQELLKIPGILKAYVIPEKDSEYGFRPIAYVEKQGLLDNEVILSVLNDKLSGLYRPKVILPWKDPPRTSWKQ